MHTLEALCLCTHVGLNLYKVWLGLGHKLKHQPKLKLNLLLQQTGALEVDFLQHLTTSFSHWNTKSDKDISHSTYVHTFLFMINTIEILWDELQMEGEMRLSATEKLILNQNFGNICVTSFHFTWQTELLKVLMQVWACIKCIFCNETNRLIPHCKNVAFCLLIYPPL